MLSSEGGRPVTSQRRCGTRDVIGWKWDAGGRWVDTHRAGGNKLPGNKLPGVAGQGRPPKPLVKETSGPAAEALNK